jgi:hypothetical protein
VNLRAKLHVFFELAAMFVGILCGVSASFFLILQNDRDMAAVGRL